MSLRRRAVVAGAAALLAACIPFGEQEPQRYYVLEPRMEAKRNVSANPREGTLLVAPTTASAFYETPQIVYSRAPGERAYYQLSSWTERPGERITYLLVRRLERARLFEAVALAASGVQGSLVLNTYLADFYHDAATPPGRVEVALTAELVDNASSQLLARRAFQRSAPAPTHDAAGAVAAFNEATGAMLDDIATWVAASAPH